MCVKYLPILLKSQAAGAALSYLPLIRTGKRWKQEMRSRCILGLYPKNTSYFSAVILQQFPQPPPSDTHTYTHMQRDQNAEEKNFLFNG